VVSLFVMDRGALPVSLKNAAVVPPVDGRGECAATTTPPGLCPATPLAVAAGRESTLGRARGPASGHPDAARRRRIGPRVYKEYLSLFMTDLSI
jgi:hypothetical protein